MIFFANITNPLQPREGLETYRVKGPHTIASLLLENGIDRYESPIVVYLDGEITLRETWDRVLPKTCSVVVSPAVQFGAIVAIVVLVVAVAAIAYALSITPSLPAVTAGDKPNESYSLKGQTNQIKLGSAIESLYGQTRHWPSYASKPYNKYIGNNSWQYSLFCMGWGEFDFDLNKIRIEDTPIADFEDVEYQIVPPGGTVTLFRDNVQTSTEVSNIELYGPNEPEYTGDGYFEIVLNDAQTQTDLIEIDIIFNGLYYQKDSGGLAPVTVDLQFQYKEIDDSGNDIGSWADLLLPVFTEATLDSKRFTRSASVPAGRYMLRGRRIALASVNARTGDTAIWETAKAYLPNVGEYPDKTVIALKARATSNLNDNSARKFNVVATRKLPIYDPNAQAWSAPTATRSVVWAFCDIFKAAYGAYIADEFLDLAELAALDATLTSEGRYFDFIFDSKMPIWEAAKTIANAARGIPILNVGKATIIVDRVKPVPQHLFNGENIVKGSLVSRVAFFKSEENDSVMVEYRDPDTWKIENIECYLPDQIFGEAENPETIQLLGVTDRDNAYRDGMKIISDRQLRRREFEFKTGTEGFLATYGDRIRIEHDSFGLDDSIGGVVVRIENDLKTIHLSQPLTIDPAKNYQISFRGTDGTFYGDYDVTAGIDDYQVVSILSVDADAIAPDRDIDGFIVTQTYSPIFILGSTVSFSKDAVITDIQPNEDFTVSVAALEYKSAVYDYEAATAPPKGTEGQFIESAALPIVTAVKMESITASEYRISWNGSTAALRYVVQFSIDPDNYDTDPNEAWDTIGTTEATTIDASILVDYVYVRVAGISTLGQGPWAYAQQLIAGASRIDTDGIFRIDVNGDTRVTLPND